MSDDVFVGNYKGENGEEIPILVPAELAKMHSQVIGITGAEKQFNTLPYGSWFRALASGERPCPETGAAQGSSEVGNAEAPEGASDVRDNRVVGQGEEPEGDTPAE